MALHLDLTDEEQQILKEVLESDLPDLRMEIRETDNREFRAMLKNKEQVLGKILAALTPAEEGT